MLRPDRPTGLRVQVSRPQPQPLAFAITLPVMRKFLDVLIFAQLPRAGKSFVGQPLGPCPGSNSLLWEEAKAGWGIPLSRGK